MRVTNRFAAVTMATVAAVAGLTLTGILPAAAAAIPSNFIGGPQITHSGCEIGLFWARLSSSTPAEVAAEVDSSHPGHTCVGFVERSATSKTKWVVASAKVAVPSVSGLQGIANTGLVYDGPGYKARACVQIPGSSAVTCTSAHSLAKGSGTATSPAFPASYERKQASVFRTSSSGIVGGCAGVVVSSTTTKKTGSTVFGLLAGEADPCTAWIQTTANDGKTWTTVSPVVPLAGISNSVVLAFTAHYSDNPGHLARLCVKDMISKKSNCSGGW